MIFGALLLEGYVRREDLEGPEWYVLLLLSASGGVVMASANDLIVLFIGLEVLSVAAYVLAAMHSRRLSSLEAGPQVLRAGRVLVGLPPVRHRADLRRNRLDQPGHDPGVPVRHA